jgi:hypothetical protein
LIIDFNLFTIDYSNYFNLPFDDFNLFTITYFDYFNSSDSNLSNADFDYFNSLLADFDYFNF